MADWKMQGAGGFGRPVPGDPGAVKVVQVFCEERVEATEVVAKRVAKLGLHTLDGYHALSVSGRDKDSDGAWPVVVAVSVVPGTDPSEFQRLVATLPEFIA